MIIIKLSFPDFWKAEWILVGVAGLLFWRSKPANTFTLTSTKISICERPLHCRLPKPAFHICDGLYNTTIQQCRPELGMLAFNRLGGEILPSGSRNRAWTKTFFWCILLRDKASKIPGSLILRFLGRIVFRKFSLIFFVFCRCCWQDLVEL